MVGTSLLNTNYNDNRVYKTYKMDTISDSYRKQCWLEVGKTAEMSFGNPHVNSDEDLPNNKIKKSERKIGILKISAVARWKDIKAVPGVWNSLEEIELEFENESKELEVEVRKTPESGKKIKEEISPSPSGKRIDMAYRWENNDNSYTLERNSTKVGLLIFKIIVLFIIKRNKTFFRKI